MSTVQITERDIKEFKVFVSIRDFVQIILFNVAKDLVYNHLDSKKGTLTLKEFWLCLENEKKKDLENEKKTDILPPEKKEKKKNKKKQSAKQPEKCSCPLMPSIHDYKFNYDYVEKAEESGKYLDISKCSSIILMMKTENPENKIFENVTDIKNIRNEFIKNTWEIPELEETKNNLIDLVEVICENMKMLYRDSKEIPVKYKKLGEKYLEKINELWDAEIGSDDLKFIKLLKDTRSGDYKQFILECQNHLIGTYKRLMESSPLLEEKFKFNIDTVFVEPLLKHNDSSLSKLQDNSVLYNEILERKLSNQDTDIPVVIIKADAGHGKTSICKKLTLDWCNSMENNPSECEYELLLFIEVRRATENGIYQYLKEILLKNLLFKVNAREEDIICFLKQLKLLIIIDAYDEKSKEAQSLISNLLDFQTKKKKIVITTRPHYKYMSQITTAINDKGLLYVDLDLQGLKDEKEYIKKVWDLKKEDEEFLSMDKFLNYITGLKEDFRNLLKVPLIMFLLIYLWVKTPTIKNLTFTSLYCQILDLQKETMKKKLFQNINEKVKGKEIDDMIKKFFNLFSEKCYNQLLKNKEMSTKCIEEMKPFLEKEFKILNLKTEYIDTVLSTLFISTRNLKDIDNKNIFQYEFLHKTQFEFFVAYYAASTLTDCGGSQTLSSLEIFNEKNLRNSIDEFSFFLGILNNNQQINEKFANDIMKVMESNITSNFNHYWKFLSQTITDHSENDSASDIRPNKELCKCFGNILHSEWCLRDGNVSSGLNILCYANFKPESIAIDISTNSNKILSFESTFINVVQSLSKCPGKDKISLKLEFSNHAEKSYEINEENTSDRILTCLKPSCPLNLKSFRGHIKTIKAVDVLNTCLELEHLHIKVALIPVLKRLVEVCNKKNLKSLTLIFDNPYDIDKIKELPRLNIKDRKKEPVKISITYHSVPDTNRMIENLVKMKPSDNTRFAKVQLETDENVNPEEWLGKIRRLTLKVAATSSYKMTKEELVKIRKKLTVEWNGEK